jgi:hypothetical protein
VAEEQRRLGFYIGGRQDRIFEDGDEAGGLTNSMFVFLDDICALFGGKVGECVKDWLRRQLDVYRRAGGT